MGITATLNQGSINLSMPFCAQAGTTERNPSSPLEHDGDWKTGETDYASLLTAGRSMA